MPTKWGGKAPGGGGDGDVGLIVSFPLCECAGERHMKIEKRGQLFLAWTQIVLE